MSDGIEFYAHDKIYVYEFMLYIDKFNFLNLYVSRLGKRKCEKIELGRVWDFDAFDLFAEAEAAEKFTTGGSGSLRFVNDDLNFLYKKYRHINK